MECLDPPLQEVPVDEWFCPECATPGTGPATGNAHLSRPAGGVLEEAKRQGLGWGALWGSFMLSYGSWGDSALLSCGGVMDLGALICKAWRSSSGAKPISCHLAWCAWRPQGKP